MATSLPAPGALGRVTRTVRHLNRYRQILTVMVRYGFGDLIDRLRIAQYLEQGRQWITGQQRPQVERLTLPERLRMVLEELGPTFIKLGQVLSTRPDLIPQEYVDELTKLQQQVPPFPFEDARRIVEEDLDRPLSELFTSFAEKPIAAGSIGQVHAARLPQGEQVAVKVRRPHIEQLVQTDLEILSELAELYERHTEAARVYQPKRIVAEFQRVITDELDFTKEAAHLERFAAQFAADETVYVPRVYSRYSGECVLTLEFVSGTHASEYGRLVAENHDTRLIAQRGAHLTLKQIFEHGFFHGDPHPGNILVMPGDVICLLDFGMTGRLDRETRERFADLVYAVARRDALDGALALLKLCDYDRDHPPDLRRLEREVAEFIDLQLSGDLADLDVRPLLAGLLDLVARTGMMLPAELVMMLKALATVENLAERLDPSLNMMALARPYLERLRRARFSPRRILHEIGGTLADIVNLLREMPDGARDLMRLARRDGLKVVFHHRGLDDVVDSLERVANRLSFAIVLAALIVGSSLIVHAELPPKIWGMPVIGLVGYMTAGIMGFALLLQMLRRGRF